MLNLAWPRAFRILDRRATIYFFRGDSEKNFYRRSLRAEMLESADWFYFGSL